MAFNPNEHQHVRYNPLKDEWVLVSPHRSLRPWSGKVEDASDEEIPQFDPKNPLCPGVTRGNGLVTPKYTSTYVFKNDFPALLEEGPETPQPEDDLFIFGSALGTCKVMCFHPNSNVHYASMADGEILTIINEWQNQMNEMGEKFQWIQIFENKGQMMGCSNPHPHCQIWCSSFLPNEARAKDLNQKKYFEKHGRTLLGDYTAKELLKKERVVCENQEWVVVVPFWAVWPFETMVLPKAQVQRITDLNENQKVYLAKIMKLLVTKYDNIFKCSFPYSMGWHGAPTGDGLKEDQRHWTFHGVFLPPLLRSASVKKFMVGYELLAQPQRDITPEKAAVIIREQCNIHYSLSKKL